MNIKWQQNFGLIVLFFSFQPFFFFLSTQSFCSSIVFFIKIFRNQFNLLTEYAHKFFKIKDFKKDMID